MRIGPSELILLFLLPVVAAAVVTWLVVRSVGKKKEQTARKQDTGSTLSPHQEPTLKSGGIEGQPPGGIGIPDPLDVSPSANSNETSKNIAVCATHPSFAAVGSCHVCGRFCCASCARYIGSDVYCSMHYDYAQQVNQNESSPSKDVIRIGSGKMFLAIVAGLVVWGLFSTMGGIESAEKSLFKQ